MNRIGAYEVKCFSKNRRNIALLLKEGARKHSVHALIEVDVTTARALIHKYAKKTGVKISFTGWIVKCIAEAITEHKELNTYRHGRRKAVVFEDVDVPIPIERADSKEQRPMAYVLRKANEKNVLEITDEIRTVQREEVDESTQLLGGNLTRLERLVLNAPAVIQILLSFILRRSAFLRKKHMGTVGVTSIGMFGRYPGWGIPLGIPATLVAVGGINKKPGVVNDKIEIREYLNMTITVDHDLVDGAPLARFVSRLSELTESAFGLSSLKTEPSIK
jgi:pyruvate/2-oxoglutarate dehydrogenase complex dihydrolipoamide acyltransferase (E2) component